MAKRTPVRLMLIVTGSTLRAEEKDRPLAYYLKQRIEKILRDDAIPDFPPGPGARDDADEGDPDSENARPDGLQVQVVADFRWIHDDVLQGLPTISLGGPGVNALAHRWLEDVPISLAVNDRYFIQMDPELDEPRASIWGMDNTSTQIAISVFTDRFLPRFLGRCAAIPPTSLESDDDDEEDEENEEDIDDDEEDDEI
jgi:hypothetical protein